MKKLWDKAELLAIDYLKRNDYNIIDTNFKFSRFWEIDIIAKKDDLVVFIEVKYRSSQQYWTWEESIWRLKKQKILKTIDYFCVKNKIDFEKIRFDVIIILKMLKNYRLIHYKNQEL